MIILDTHIWIWWIHKDKQLPPAAFDWIESIPPNRRFVSIVSCWEVAKLIAKRRLKLEQPLDEWINGATVGAGLRIFNLTPQICIEANFLPGDFHNDPADQMIVATTRVLGGSLATADGKILQYPHVPLAPMRFY